MDDRAADGGERAAPDAIPPAVRDLFVEMGRRSLPSPPVPHLVRSHVRSWGNDVWGTHRFDPMAHYLFRDCWQSLVTDRGDDPLFTFSHAGHGINSYFYTLTLRIGPLAVAAQSHWSPWPIYADRLMDITDMAHQYMNLRMLLEGVEGQPGPLRWVLLASPSRGILTLIDVTRLDPNESWSVLGPRLPVALDGGRGPISQDRFFELVADALGFPLDRWGS